MEEVERHLTVCHLSTKKKKLHSAYIKCITEEYTSTQAMDPARNSPGGNLVSHFSEKCIEIDNWSIQSMLVISYVDIA